MKNGFLKVAAATPEIRLADPISNAGAHIALAREAETLGARLICFPELSLCGSGCGDLFLSDKLISASAKALSEYLTETRELDVLSLVGLPVYADGRLYNAVAVCKSGDILGIVPKRYLSKTSGEARYFAPAADMDEKYIELCGRMALLSDEVLFECAEMRELTLAVEIGSEQGLPLSPALVYGESGATVICCPAASPEAVGAADARRLCACSTSARICGAYIYASSGRGESTGEGAFGGHRMIVEDGKLIAEAEPFSAGALTVSELDLGALAYKRRKNGICEGAREIGRVEFNMEPTVTALTRHIAKNPFVPEDKTELDRRAEQMLTIAAEGIAARMQRAYAKKLVIGISGGLDSTLALLIATRATDLLGRPREDIIAVTMPCFGTTARTKSNATTLCAELEVDFRQVDIFDAVNLHFRDIGHDPEKHDVTYENAQARERTQILMDIANGTGGMVVGTGDMSELALGWATYNGDHMSMYGVNASIPKTLVRHIVAYAADVYEREGKTSLSESLRDVLGTPVSPELLPADLQGNIAQRTEDLVGPYDIHDFYLYHMLRDGASPEKLLRMADHALGGEYDRKTLLHWLEVFTRRFFTQQFKRSCMPDGPSVGALSLSPRGGLSMPSDASYAIWQSEIEEMKKGAL